MLAVYLKSAASQLSLDAHTADVARPIGCVPQLEVPTLTTSILKPVKCAEQRKLFEANKCTTLLKQVMLSSQIANKWAKTEES